MNASFLGVGWKFPVALGQGRIAMAEFEESIRESIWIILATARGERKMRPDFGCGIHDLVFATASGETEGRVASEVRQALILWEPRIDVIDVSARNDEAEPTRLLIQIEYRVRATNNRFNLVYPFYLE
ncbi:MAG TPA: GPW/gp25 family protein [Thermoanaerobaculia bacterium]|nr:GPW/gp25 family protein [Thermoanaerobaculia bacterium]